MDVPPTWMGCSLKIYSTNQGHVQGHRWPRVLSGWGVPDENPPDRLLDHLGCAEDLPTLSLLPEAVDSVGHLRPGRSGQAPRKEAAPCAGWGGTFTVTGDPR